VVDVGAGTGNYEPTGRKLTAVEPSAAMIAQRPADAAPVVEAAAESLPFADQSFDAAMATWTLHHWADWRNGIRELRRVTRGRIVIATWDTTCASALWLTRDYLPEAAASDVASFPALCDLLNALDGGEVEPILIPSDCHDGFMAAYWARPEAYLDPTVRANISTFALLPARRLERALTRLAGDLDGGVWNQRHGHLRNLPELDLGYRLIVSNST
jgi:SAM-dependent methyltransferase